MNKQKVRKATLSIGVPKASWLHPYIGYPVLIIGNIMIIDMEVYENEDYDELGYFEDIEDVDVR